MSFFDEHNPFLKMFNDLTPEAQAEYARKGKDMYEFINFETGELYDSEELPKSCLSVESIKRLLQSGLSFSDLTEEEQEMLHSVD
jgi:hypothetical protein